MSIKPNPIAIRNLRNAKGFSQETLAAKIKMNVRTVQRAEAGIETALETLQFIADELDVPLDRLITEDVESGPLPKGQFVVRPSNSGNEISELLTSAFEVEIHNDAEPNLQNLNILKGLVELIEKLQSPVSRHSNPVHEPSRSERLDVIAGLNEFLQKARKIGIRVFLGKYSILRYPAHWDYEIDSWVTRPSRSQKKNFWRCVVWISDTPDAQISLFSNELERQQTEDEIPF